MRCLVYFTKRLPSKIADHLTAAGYRVFEALAISEVLHLCETENVDAIVIDSSVNDPSVVAKARRISITLEPGARSEDLIAELLLLFPSASPLVQ